MSQRLNQVLTDRTGRWRAVFCGFAVLFVAAVGVAGCTRTDPAETVLQSEQSGFSLQPQSDGIEDDEEAGSSDPLALELTYFDGSTGTLDQLAGTPTVINFFASYCVPCRTELPHFEETFQRWGDDVNFVGVATNDDRLNATDLIDDTGITFPVVDDPNQELFFALSGFSMPTTVFLNADGSVASTRVGVIAADKLETAVTELASAQ